MHSAALDGMQSEMQEIWQEQLDRVRRQQIIYREKVEEILNLRETARQILTAAKQLVPYVSCILNMNAMIDPKYGYSYVFTKINKYFSDVVIHPIQLQWRVFVWKLQELSQTVKTEFWQLKKKKRIED